ncbi:hypothetical protein LZC95_06970 [Pendulispora brunnea]|uniref:Uncharacterized protein n=1 Tax=Pendulispora brunnea TaxID=2905690 RepID=A0ABZ2KI31_9BACT
MSRKVAFVGFGVALMAGLLAMSVASCTQNSNQVNVRSFELARQVDFVCMRVYGRLATDDPNTLRAIPAQPTVPGNCPPVPTNVDGTFINWHLFALVTQFTRGEVAVVDLTAGTVVDIDRQTPGINFLPVGAQPTDVVVSPDGKMTFVAAAEPNKPAIYGIANREILGDSQQSQGLPAEGTRPIPKLTTWPVCALPQKPGAISIVPRNTNNDGGTDVGPPESQYEIAVVLPGEAGKSAKLITLDPKPFLRGADPATPPGDSGALLDERLEPTPGPRLEPGALQECPITSAIELSGDVPDTWKPGPQWDDGIRNAAGDAGNALPPALGCAAPAPGGGGGGGAQDAGDAGDAGPAADAGPDLPIPSVSQGDPFGAYAARDGQTLYVADGALPIIHVMDLSTPGSPKELPPLVATSQVNPLREVSVGQIAVSPPTREFKKYLYAVDRKEGSIMVYDVTDPATSPRVPLSRPHPEVNPFQTPDRLSFGVPVAALTFVRHDFSPRNPNDGTLMTAGVRGALCNPNSNASSTPGAADFDPGTLFREDAQNQDPALLLGPSRLRGIFAFVTLTNGRMIAVDVDDWDSPCRRPLNMSIANSSVTPPLAATGGRGAYEAPQGVRGQSNELYFPMTAPNRARSQYRIRYTTTDTTISDSLGSGHVPTLEARPQLLVNGNTLQTVGPEGRANPLLVPTSTGYPDPRFFDPVTRQEVQPDIPGIRFSYEQPEVHFDQDWATFYEGVLPGMDGFQGILTKNGDYETMTLSQPAASFCRKGVEDARLGAQRAALLGPAMSQAGLLTPAAPLEQHLGDYVQITDDILDVSDPYWAQANSCWEGDLAQPAGAPQAPASVATARHDACVANFRNFSDEITPSAYRDFPILEAYDDHLVLGAYSYPPGSSLSGPDIGRRLIERNASFNRVPLRTMQCCFHNQAHFRVRTGGEWLALGSSVGYLHHIIKDANNACVQSCATRDQLLNARIPALPYPCRGTQNGQCTNLREDLTSVPLLDRNSPLVMRNPALSFGIYNGTRTGNDNAGPFDAPPPRDARWGFTTRGGYVNYTLNLASTTTSVSPQSMRFVEAFQQLAVVDGAAQGLMLFDLNNVTLAHSPYF